MYILDGTLFAHFTVGKLGLRRLKLVSDDPGIVSTQIRLTSEPILNRYIRRIGKYTFTSGPHVCVTRTGYLLAFGPASSYTCIYILGIFIGKVLLVPKTRRITQESRNAYRLPIFPGVSCEKKNEGSPVT